MTRRRSPIRDLLFVLAVASAADARAQQPTVAAPAQGEALDDRLHKLEATSRAILERLDRSEQARRRSDDRYRSLESRYEELLRRVDAPSAAAEAAAPVAPLPRGLDLGGIDDGAGDGPAGSGPMIDDERP